MPITSRNRNKLGIFALVNDDPGRQPPGHTLYAVVYADVGFRYKYSMSEAVVHHGALSQAPALSALGRRSVVLVGMMGAGKSSIGRRLATRLGLNFVDA